MAALLTLLIVAILNGALSYVDSAINLLVPISLNAENYMSSLMGTNSFEALFDMFFSFGIVFIVLKFIKKGFETYVLWTDGDPDGDPLTLLTNFIKAIVIAVSFKYIYSWFAEVVTQMTDKGLKVIGLSAQADIATLTTGIASAGLFTAIISLIFFICFFILYIQFLMKGMELLILRIGLPLACTGLMDSDKGIFKTYISKFVQALTAIVVQLILTKTGIVMMLNLHAFWGLAAIILAIRTPKFLSEFLITTGGGHGLSTVYQSVQLVRAVKAFGK